jgi:hypothetical protein
MWKKKQGTPIDLVVYHHVFESNSRFGVYPKGLCLDSRQNLHGYGPAASDRNTGEHCILFDLEYQRLHVDDFE